MGGGRRATECGATVARRTSLSAIIVGVSLSIARYSPVAVIRFAVAAAFLYSIPARLLSGGHDYARQLLRFFEYHVSIDSLRAIPSLNPHKHPMEVYYNKNVTETLAQRVVRLSI